jgi:hypothetical protein
MRRDTAGETSGPGFEEDEICAWCERCRSWKYAGFDHCRAPKWLTIRQQLSTGFFSRF